MAGPLSLHLFLSLSHSFSVGLFMSFLILPELFSYVYSHSISTYTYNMQACRTTHMIYSHVHTHSHAHLCTRAPGHRNPPSSGPVHTLEGGMKRVYVLKANPHLIFSSPCLPGTDSWGLEGLGWDPHWYLGNLVGITGPMSLAETQRETERDRERKKLAFCRSSIDSYVTLDNPAILQGFNYLIWMVSTLPSHFLFTTPYLQYRADEWAHKARAAYSFYKP